MLKTDKSYRRNFHSIVDDLIPYSIVEKNNKTKSWNYGYHKEYDLVCISKDGTLGQILNIGGLNIGLPKQPKHIRLQEKTQDLQKWTRYSVPNDLKYFDKYFSKEKEIEKKFDEVSESHKEFIFNDFKRQDEGDWFMNDGEAIYINGGYYFFLQHYFLPEDGVYPNFRMPQRDYFLWLEACYADNRCIGSLLLKSRRSSFTVTSTSEILRTSIRYKNSYYPIMADVEKHAKRIFQNYIVKPFLSLPKHLQPMRSGNAVPQKELKFEAIKTKMTTNSKLSAEADGLNSSIEYVATTNNAYDSTRPRMSLNDEIGKPEIDIVDWWAVHKKCHLEGDELKGKAICGSTANPLNKGGKPYKILYENSKLSTRGDTGFTKSGLYAIFIPADFAQSGYFDKWGYVIYNDPKEPIENEFGKIKEIGSKTFLDSKEAQNIDNIKGYNYEKRNDPRVDSDAFLDEDASNMYATTGMMNHIKFLTEYQTTTKYKSEVFSCDFIWKNGVVDSEVVMKRYENINDGKFLIHARNGLLPIPLERRNNHSIRNNKKAPINGHIALMGVDPYLANRTQYGTGSKQGIVGMTSNHYELPETQQEKVWLYYNYRSKDTVEDAYEDVIKVCLYFSIPCLPEHNKNGLVKKMFERGYRNFVLNSPLKRGSELTPDERTYGGMNTSNNVKFQEQALETYVKQKFHEDIDEDNIPCAFNSLNELAIEYNSSTRTKCDGVVAWQFALLALSKAYHAKQKQEITVNSDIKLVDRFNFNSN